MGNPFSIEKTYNAPIEQVWLAFTNKEEMKEWYFEVDAFKPEVGFKFTFPGKGSNGENYLHHCKILEIIPFKKLKHTWRYEGYEGDSVLTIQLDDLGEKTKVKLTHEGLETFPQENQDFKIESFNKGWNTILGELLPKFLENNT